MRLPPTGYELSDARFAPGRANLDGHRLANRLGVLHPEVGHWHDSALVAAWHGFCRQVLCVEVLTPLDRNEKFVAYLYVCECLPVYRWLAFDPADSDLDEAWTAYDVGRLPEHTRALYARHPTLQERFCTWTHLSGELGLAEPLPD